MLTYHISHEIFTQALSNHGRSGVKQYAVLTANWLSRLDFL